MENTIIKKYGNRKYLQFKKLNEFNGIIHGFTVRNKDFKNTEEDYEKVCNDLKLSKKYLKIDKQIHSGKVKCVSNNSSVTDIDGIITNQKGLPLFIRTADCISMVFYDPIKEVIANIHSGWKGTLNRIAENTVKQMEKEYECDPKNMIVCFFPSILMCHFEVEDDVYSLYIEEFKELNNIQNYIKIGNIKDGNRKYYIDTVAINNEMLLNMKLKEENIYLSNKCTMCDNNLFFSHRKKDDGRNLTFIQMKGTSK